MRLRQRLAITQCYLTALERSALPSTQDKVASSSPLQSTTMVVPTTTTMVEQGREESTRIPRDSAALGLARVGSRTARFRVPAVRMRGGVGRTRTCGRTC